MKTITLARSLKEKNRLVSELNSLVHRFKTNNSFITGNKPDYYVSDIENEIGKCQTKLIALKTIICEANKPVQSLIFRIAENKMLIDMYKSTPTTSGKAESGRYGSGDMIDHTAIFTQKAMDERIKKANDDLIELHEQLDAFNNTTKIEVDL